MYMAEKLDLPGRWQFELAAMLSQIGSVTVPPEVMEKYQSMEPLTADEAQIVTAQSRIGHDLLAQIPRLELVARMVANQETKWTHSAAKPDAAVIGAALLKIARDFDEQVTRGAESGSTLAAMKRSPHYNPEFIDALEQVDVEESHRTLRLVNLAQLRTKMIVHADVRAKSGLLLLAKDQEVTETAIARLRSFAKTVGIVEPLQVIAHWGGQEVADDRSPRARAEGEPVLR
jgi:hypothetical protein